MNPSQGFGLPGSFLGGNSEQQREAYNMFLAQQQQEQLKAMQQQQQQQNGFLGHYQQFLLQQQQMGGVKPIVFNFPQQQQSENAYHNQQQSNPTSDRRMSETEESRLKQVQQVPSFPFPPLQASLASAAGLGPAFNVGMSHHQLPSTGFTTRLGAGTIGGRKHDAKEDGSSVMSNTRLLDPRTFHLQQAQFHQLQQQQELERQSHNQGSGNNGKPLSNSARSVSSNHSNEDAPSQKEDQKPLKSKYRGVSWHKRDKSWTARIWKDGKSEHLGTFPTELRAALAVDIKALEYFGEDCTELNFPDAKERKRIIWALIEEPGDEEHFETKKRRRQVKKHKTLPVTPATAAVLAAQGKAPAPGRVITGEDSDSDRSELVSEKKQKLNSVDCSTSTDEGPGGSDKILFVSTPTNTTTSTTAGTNTNATSNTTTTNTAVKKEEKDTELVERNTGDSNTVVT